jgi:hypothetical protein
MLEVHNRCTIMHQHERGNFVLGSGCFLFVSLNVGFNSTEIHNGIFLYMPVHPVQDKNPARPFLTCQKKWMIGFSTGSAFLAPLELQCAKNAPKLDICVPGARYRR